MVTHILPGGLLHLTRSQPPGKVHLGVTSEGYGGAVRDPHGSVRRDLLVLSRKVIYEGELWRRRCR